MRAYKYRVILKSGACFSLEADDLDVAWDDDTGQITSFNFKNPQGEVPVHLPAERIDTILEMKP